MKVRTSEEAKTLAVELMSRRPNREEAERRLVYFRERLANAHDEESRTIWKQQADDLVAWIGSDAYKTGDFPQSVDQLILELAEWRAMISAFESVETEKSPFKDCVFFSQWLVGAGYAVFSIFGKLARGDARTDITLKSVWDQVSDFIAQDGACPADEMAAIDKCLHERDGRFTNGSSRALLFRNKVIAHNERSMGIAWKEIDADIRVLARIWSLLVSWSSFGIVAPFRTAEQAFSGLEHFFSPTELQAMKAKRAEYLEEFKAWCATYLHSGEIDPGRTAFATVSVKVRVVR